MRKDFTVSSYRLNKIVFGFYHQHTTLFLESEVIILRNYSHLFVVVVG